MDVIESKPRSLDLQVRLGAVERLAWRAIKQFEQDAHADQSTAELDIEASEPFRRLIGQQEGRDKGEELSGCRAGFEYPITAVDDSESNCDSAKRLHQGVGPRAKARQLVGLILDRGDLSVETLAHDVFERKCSDDADALQRFLQGLDDAGAAVKLGPGDCVDAPDQLAQKEKCGRDDHE